MVERSTKASSTPADPYFGPPVIDVDQWRDNPVRHRYVHGHFTGTATRFAFSFPDRPGCGERFLNFLEGGAGGNEHAGGLWHALEMAVENGAYLVESNQGHSGDLSVLGHDRSVLDYRASAASCRLAREMAAEHYGHPTRRGYLLGGSGGAMRAVACLEHAPDLYDGAVPYMVNHWALWPYNYSAMAYAEPRLRSSLARIVDAVDAGGSGDPFAACVDEVARSALADLYRSGYPRGAEHVSDR